MFRRDVGIPDVLFYLFFQKVQVFRFIVFKPPVNYFNTLRFPRLGLNEHNVVISVGWMVTPMAAKSI